MQSMPWSRCADMAYLHLSRLHKVSVKVPVARVNCPVRETTILVSRPHPAGLRTEANILYIPMTVQMKSFASMQMWEIPMSIILSF